MMTLELLGQELRKRRQEKQVSLMDIAAETRINVKFLEAIEEGRFSILPQTYVRAFLREYGEAIGFGADEIMRQYDAVQSPHQPQHSHEPPAQPASGTTTSPAATFIKKSPSQVQKTVVFVAVLAVALAITIFLTNSNSTTVSTKSTTEIPFDRVVKETEAATIKPEPVQNDSVIVVPAKADSLRLEIFTSDSVWMSILIDGKKTEEFLFPPKRKKIWLAREQFAVTMGNAGGATFQLNGRDIGSLGRRGAVVRNTLITEATLKK